MSAPVVIGSDTFCIARVPEGASAGELIVGTGDKASEAWTCDVGIQIADSLHPVANPAVDNFGNIFSTFSGSRGQKVPVAVYQASISTTASSRSSNDIMNATGLAFDRAAACSTFRAATRR